MEFTPDIPLDAELVVAANLNCLNHAAGLLGLSPTTAVHRIKWLKRQDSEYIRRVELEGQKLSDQLWSDYDAEAN